MVVQMACLSHLNISKRYLHRSVHELTGLSALDSLTR